MSSFAVPTTTFQGSSTTTTAHDYETKINKTAVTGVLGMEVMRPYPVLAGCVIAVIVLAGNIGNMRQAIYIYVYMYIYIYIYIYILANN